jgi:hypothetical protein
VSVHSCKHFNFFQTLRPKWKKEANFTVRRFKKNIVGYKNEQKDEEKNVFHTPKDFSSLAHFFFRSAFLHQIETLHVTF